MARKKTEQQANKSKKKQSSRKKTIKSNDLILVFKNVKTDLDVNYEVYSENDKIRIKEIVDHFSNEISLDKSYVIFKENAHNDAFITEVGWSNLMKDLIKTDFGKKMTEKQYYETQITFGVLAEAYLYYILENYYGYDQSNIKLEVIPSKNKNKYFDVGIIYDTIYEWKTYTEAFKKIWKLKELPNRQKSENGEDLLGDSDIDPLEH